MCLGSITRSPLARAWIHGGSVAFTPPATIERSAAFQKAGRLRVFSVAASHETDGCNIGASFAPWRTWPPASSRSREKQGHCSSSDRTSRDEGRWRGRLLDGSDHVRRLCRAPSAARHVFVHPCDSCGGASHFEGKSATLNRRVSPKSVRIMSESKKEAQPFDGLSFL